jgi:hypothetical protein
MLRAWSFAALAITLLTACGGPPAPAAPTPEPSSAPSAAPSAAPRAESEADKPFTQIPAECATPGDKTCTPPKPFVKRLCGGFFPEVALAMFGKGTPWTRGYLRREVEAWNASGGVSSSDKLVFDEEVLIMVFRSADSGGMVVSGSTGSYDVLRWNGTCASLMGEEVTTRQPPAPKYAKIPWKSLGEATREALLANDKVGKIAAERKKECKGATMGEVSAKCEKADSMLSTSVIDYVRSGGALPAPAKMP